MAVQVLTKKEMEFFIDSGYKFWLDKNFSFGWISRQKKKDKKKWRGQSQESLAVKGPAVNVYVPFSLIFLLLNGVKIVKKLWFLMG